ncbi:arylacetamide deacetylase-like isoform X2 [Brevipalpus obovatus]|uniref:arylacetamide deacetylase-like isoform X2 n=1 Tax=Brevipalpus obovatus TaxID=246614 RepID=UPI003D9DDF77
MCNHIADELERICQKILKLAHNDEDVVKKLQKLQEAGQSIASWADGYNFGDLQANGYTSLLRIGLKLGQCLLGCLENSKDGHISMDLANLLNFALIAVDVLHKLREDSLLQASSVSLFVQLFGLLLRIDNQIIGPAYGTHCAFWLNKWSQFTAKLVSSALSFMSTGLYDRVKCLIDAKYRGLTFAHLIKNADIVFVMKLRTLLHSFAYRKILPFVLYGSTSTKEFPVSRQTTWILSSERNNMLIRSQDDSSSDANSASNGSKVRAKLYRGRQETPQKDQLAFYVHGGGFVLGTPESHDVFICDWTNKLGNIPILSVDYSLSPEVKFPVALQEILDVYLWVTNGSEEVRETLGYIPKTIVLVGDSAGGNLITSMTMVINDILKLDPHFHTFLPKSLVCLYAPFDLTLKLTPSMVLAACDSLLSAGLMLSCFEAYIPLFNHQDSNDGQIPTQSWGLGSVLFRLYETIKDFVAPNAPPKPWYRADEKELTETVHKLYQITSSPYISPLLYDDFASLSSVSLHLFSLHFDPFLDHSIIMADKWQGKATLKVFDGLQHGFLNFLPFLKEGVQASNEIIQCISNCLNSD